jgi:uncharacterized protein (TIGR03435 family)
MRYATMLLALLLFGLSMEVSTQTPVQPSGDGLRFDVASVKPSRNEPGGGPPTPGALVIRGATLEDLITRLYGIKSFQLEGAPNWIRLERFDISARSASGSATEAETFKMLRQLLADRFGLRLHPETRQAPVYKLRLARADGQLGPGLNRTSADCQRSIEAGNRGSGRAQGAAREVDPLRPICGITFSSPVAGNAGLRLTMGGVPLAELVQRIAGQLETPVVDETGLTGLFDIVVAYERTGPALAAQSSASDINAELPPPPLQSGLPEQLGLKLERQTGPTQILVIDAIQWPMPD